MRRSFVSRRWRRSVVPGVLLCSPLASAWDDDSGERDTISCHCLYGDNKWFYFIGELLELVNANFTERLLQPDWLGAGPEKRLVMDRECDPKAEFFPDSNLVFDTVALDRLGGAGLMMGSPRLELYEFCVPANTILSLLCAQQFLIKRRYKAALRWVQAMQHLLSFVQGCMDAESPFPIWSADLLAYVEFWQRGLAPRGGNWEPFLRAGGFFQGVARLKPRDKLSTCIPIRDPACFPRGTQNLYEGCQECCNPEYGPNGHPQCWTAAFSYVRCCNPPPVPIATDQSALCKGPDELNKKLTTALREEERSAKEAIRNAVNLKYDLEVMTKEKDAAVQRGQTLEAILEQEVQKRDDAEQRLAELKDELSERERQQAELQRRAHDCEKSSESTSAQLDAAEQLVASLEEALDVCRGARETARDPTVDRRDALDCTDMEAQLLKATRDLAKTTRELDVLSRSRNFWVRSCSRAWRNSSEHEQVPKPD